jgi:tetratricopeptide (TPR) repeat protein
MMNRPWRSITACGAAILALASVSAATDSSSPNVAGEMVDCDVPAVYRLPTVEAPAAPPATDTQTTATQTASATSPLFAAPTRLTSDSPTNPTNNEAGCEIAMNSSENHSVPLPAGAPPDDDVVDAAADGSESAIATNAPIVAPPSEPISPVATTRAPITPVSFESSDLTAQLLPAVQRGTGLAQRGAFHAARTEFIQVLRRLAQGKDAAAGTTEHSRALAAGLRALDEAEDFVPAGVQLEAEMNVRAVASSHRTQVLPEGPEEVTAFEAAALYHDYAREQLAKAAAGERAGSMALYGLGRVHSRFAEVADDDVEQTRTATTMYAAAVVACPDNHLAANELGVLVCRAGRAHEAMALFQQAIDVAPSATAYHNLAIVQQKVGMHGESAANEQESVRLAAVERAQGDVSKRAGVRWVSPNELAGVSQPGQWAVETANRPPVGQPRSAEKSFFRKWR